MVSDVLEIDGAELPERVPVEEAAHSERGEVSECVWCYQSGRGILSQAARLVRFVCLYTGEEVVLLGYSEKEDWKGTGTESSRTGSGAQAWLCHRRRVCLELPLPKYCHSRLPSPDFTCFSITCKSLVTRDCDGDSNAASQETPSLSLALDIPPQDSRCTTVVPPLRLLPEQTSFGTTTNAIGRPMERPRRNWPVQRSDDLEAHRHAQTLPPPRLTCLATPKQLHSSSE